MPAPRDLPIYSLESEIVGSLRATDRLILQAPTGSGKSTQVPQMLLEAGLLGDQRKAVILQPRRLAARMLAARVARERNAKLGGEVGYTIRFDNQSSRETRLQFVTEGILLRWMLSNPNLPEIGAILFDEFHERHLYGDITLARALQLQETKRPDLKLIVMSATLETSLLANYLGPKSVTLNSTGRTFPVEIDYLPQKRADKKPVWELAADELERLTPDFPTGDALIFMPGAFEISRTIQEIRNRSRLDRNWTPRPLHGELPVNDQDAALAPVEGGKRKVVVSTNVAETSLTIDGVRLVIDSGLARIAKFDPYRGINTLLIEKISRASADQRAGRAGRTSEGYAMRLWTQEDHLHRAQQELPEVKRLDLAEVVLTLKAGGVGDIHGFRWLEAPERRSLERAERLLESLGAIGHGPNGTITELGRRMLAFPVHPRYSRMLLAAQERNCVGAIARLAALTQGRGLFMRPTDKFTDEFREDILGRERESDFFLQMRALRYAEQSNFDPGRLRKLGIHGITARAASELGGQFLRIAKDEGLEIESNGAPSSDEIRRCILAGFADQVAKRLDGGTLRCALVGGRRGVLARESAVHEAPLLVVGEVREVEGRDSEVNTLLSLATAIEEEWLREMFPDDFRNEDETYYDAPQRRVYVRRRRYFRDLALAEKLGEDPPREESAKLLAAEIHAGRLKLEQLDDGVEQWIARLNSLRLWMPELELPALDPGDRLALLEQLCLGAFTYNQIKDRPVWKTFKSWLSSRQQGWLDEYAPERLELPGGRHRKLRYDDTGAPPVIAARIQDLYGVEGGLFVASRRVPVTIEVLAPNMRPIQITKDLANFWKESYPKIKLELQRKYPKQEWR